MAPRPRVFTIPASSPFLLTLVRALADGKLIGERIDDPLAWSRLTLFLPTRRACLLARDAFLSGLGGRAALLPRIAPLGDIDEDEFVFADSPTGEGAAEALTLLPPISPFERRITLAKLVQHWALSPELRRAGAALVVGTPLTALALADDLARLLDDLTTRQVPLAALERLAPDGLDEYWAKTLAFLKIVLREWPEALAARGVLEAAVRRERLIGAQAARLAEARDGPVIAAGSTGSIPVTATLLATIAKLPRGAVVLPGLDTDLDDASFAAIAPENPSADAPPIPAAGHPQFAMHGLLRRIGIARAEVTSLAPQTARDRLVSEALRPAATTHLWPVRLAAAGRRDEIATAMAGIAVIEAAHAEEEALAIAVALRETIAVRGRTAALVTPDRALARRVMAALGRWNVPVEDSAGMPLGETPPGVLARLAAEVALCGVPPVPLLALLKHPLCAAGAASAAVAALELAVLRGPRPRGGIEGVAGALAAFRRGREHLHRTDPRRRLTEVDVEAAEALIAVLREGLAPLARLETGQHTLADLATRHREVVARLAGPADESEPWSVLDDVFDELAASRGYDLTLRASEYPDLFALTLAGRAVRQARPDAPVRVFGLLEARLQSANRVVLGGLAEGVWPPQPRVDPWLSRPMRQALGLDLPERRIGLSAHDFAQALGAGDVVLTRAVKREGAPTVSSRFLQRLATVAGAEPWNAALARGQLYVELARALDRPQAVVPARQPAPAPPVAVRPARLAVSDIEDLLRDPYTIYARHILRLYPLAPLDTPPGAADRGGVIHAALEAFTKAYPDRLPADPAETLIAIGREAFADLSEHPEARAFWWPRFVRIAHWFAAWERERRSRIAEIITEDYGGIDIATGMRNVRLSARADRIERWTDGACAILDYKTGVPPSGKQVLAGLAPQLTLEGAILRGGGFRAAPKGASIAEFAYVRLNGGEPPGEYRVIGLKDGTPDAQADKALSRVATVLTRFETEPYRSLVLPMWTSRYGDYDHLARVQEWAASGGVDGGGEA